MRRSRVRITDGSIPKFGGCTFLHYLGLFHSLLFLPPPIYSSGATVGFASSNYTGVEGEAVEVCVTIHSPNQTVLRMSDVEGEFSITGSNGKL